jgi:tRNA threonylcarbamoyladenosine biosynthesis protein TsaE
MRLASEAETERLGRALAAVAAPDTVIALVGPLGAGKTRLVRAIAEALGVDPLAIGSPTFVLHHEYAGRLTVHHFDAYRLRDPAEFEALGVADLFQEGGVCLVEWADRVAGLLPADAWWITLAPDPVDPGAREVSLRLPPAAAGALAASARDAT